jgi:hypothetical protein
VNQSHRHRARSGSNVRATPAAISRAGIGHADELRVYAFVVPVGVNLIDEYLRETGNGDSLG